MSDIIQQVYDDVLLRYAIVFAFKMIADGHTPPADLNAAIIRGLYQHEVKPAMVEDITSGVALMYATQGLRQ